MSMTVVVDVLKKSYTDLPTSEAAVGLQESKALTEARESMTKSLVVFRDFHLPLGNAVVNDLVRTLNFFSKPYEQFKTLLQVVKKCVKDGEERAKYVTDMYIQLTGDLEKLGEDAMKALKVAETTAQEKLVAANKKSNDARMVTTGAAGVGLAGVAVGVGLFCGLMGPGGLLFAPGMALDVFGISVATGGAAASAVALGAKIMKDDSYQLKKTHDMLKQSGEVYDSLPGCTETVCWGFATFFQTIGNGLERVDQSVDDMSSRNGHSDETLRALYNSVQTEVEDLRKACEGYVSHITKVKVDIGVLDRFQGEDYRSYIDEWINCPSPMKKEDSTRDLLRKTFP